jgi:putative ABC transport system permease protein
VVLVALTAVAATAGALGGLGTGRRVLTATGRAVAQLAAVSFIIAAVIGSLALTGVFVAAMATVASGTSARRITRHRTGWWVTLAIAPAPVVTVALLVATGVVPARGIAIVPTAGILIGGAMTATSLAGIRLRDELVARRGEVEAALSIGLDDRDAAVEIARPAAASALVPALDQTRTVGLVTLPGAFVGLLLAGAAPVDAGAAQLLVLVALLAVESLAVLIVVELVCRGWVHAGPG